MGIRLCLRGAGVTNLIEGGDEMILKKVLRGTLKVLLWIVLVIVALVVISTVTHNVLKLAEQNKYKAPGTFVSVDGKKMHVYTVGSGSKTIVLMSGFGTGSPVLDFSPLAEELSKNFKVVIVEGFGYGWSDTTNSQRTVQNIVDETRAALKEAGVAPPYILMPNSISGIYSLYYANIYPDEVSAVIGIDTSVPKQADLEEFAYKLDYLGMIEQYTGAVRIATKLFPSALLPPMSDAYTDEQKKLERLMYCWHYNNISLVNEMNTFQANCETTRNMTYPAKIPVMFFLAKETMDSDYNVAKLWLPLHVAQYEEGHGQYIILDGLHYLHWKYSKEMAADTKAFLSKYAVNP